MTAFEREIREQLFAMQDMPYRDFQAGLMPTVDKETIIGVRTPALRKFAKKVAKDARVGEFLDSLPHGYYEENNLHGLLIGEIADFEQCLSRTERFLSYVDNWATCDLFAPAVFGKNKDRLLSAIRRWIASDETYRIRFGVDMLMRFYLEEDFEPEQLEMAAQIRSEEYYVRMAVAWYFATALAKQYAATIPFLEEGRLENWTHNKAIQKARESYRITPQQKEYLKSLKK